jgi:hypothetical protein
MAPESEDLDFQSGNISLTLSCPIGFMNRRKRVFDKDD